MSSIVAICNSALRKLKANSITSLTDNSEAARLCNAAWPEIRDEVLRSHPWNFALVRATLARIDETPSFGFDFVFQLPVDCLRVMQLEERLSRFSVTDNVGRRHTVRPVYKVEGRRLLTDEETARMLYVRRVEDPVEYDALFFSAVAWRMAMELSFAIVNTHAAVEATTRSYMSALAAARRADGQEGTPDELVADEWQAARI